MNLRGQGYDGAATMAGVHIGVQIGIISLNRKDLFSPCSKHSLNLAGLHSAETVVNAVTFFGTIDRLYAFFSSSTHSWKLSPHQIDQYEVWVS